MEPKLVNHDKPYVYATTDKIEAIIYSVKGGNFNYTNIYGYDDDGNRCLIERKENYLEEIYNKEGRYYELEPSSFEKHSEIGVGENEFVSEEKVKVLKEVTIPNVWQYLLEQQNNNVIKIYRYPKRPSSYPKDDSDLIECAVIMYLQMHDLDKAFESLIKYHPELIDKINSMKSYLINHNEEEIKGKIKFFT